MTAIYDQIGGDVLRSVVSDFCDRMYADPLICFLFARTDKQALVQREWEFATNLLGGRVKYTGRSLKRAHEQSLILEGHFYRRALILEQTLKDHNIAPPVRNAWIEHTFKLQPQIKYAIIRRNLPKRFGLFLGTPEQRAHWKALGIEEVFKKTWDWVLLKRSESTEHTAPEVEHYFRITLLNARKELVAFQFDAAVESMTGLLEFLMAPARTKCPVGRTTLRELVIAMTPFVPRMTEALWEQMHEPGLVHLQAYPTGGLPLTYASREGAAIA